LASLSTNRMKAYARERRVVVNLEILEARNVAVKPAGGRDGLFVRYYLSTGSAGEGNNNIAVNSREVMSKANPEWKQSFCLECGGSTEDANVISELQKQSVRFELRERSSRIKLLGSMFRASKLVGWVEIAWKDLLASPTLSINNWFPLSSINGRSQLPPSLHLAISLKPLNLVDSVSQASKEHHQTDRELYDPQVRKSCSNEIRRSSVNVNRRIKRLERDDCRCGGKVCCPGIHEEGLFAVL